MMLVAFACAPLNLSRESLVGHWKVEWTCGVETLDLNTDGTYTSTIDYSTGGRATDSGRWELQPKSEAFAGARVILREALDTCSAFGAKVDRPDRHDRQLETTWEWGETLLVFNPDVEGFTRVSE
jgi:hypothetical protein